jgi:hypothetical protein
MVVSSGMRSHFRLVLSAALFVAAPIHAALAEIGPCRKGGDGAIYCGEGENSARVIDGTTSPSMRLAFAWRQPDGLPKSDPDDVELMLVRLADGAILAELKGEYWEAGDSRANREQEWAAWSPDSRMAVELYNNRWDATITLYGLDADDAVSPPLDLRKLVEEAVVARFPRWGKGDLKDHTLRAAPGARFKKDGTLLLRVLVYIPKQDPELKLDVILQTQRLNNAMSARVLWLRRADWDAWN